MVNNITTFAGGFGVVYGSGSVTGIEIAGPGHVILGGTSTLLHDLLIDHNCTFTLEAGASLSGALALRYSTLVPNGNAMINGSLSFNDGARLQLSPHRLTVNGAAVRFSGFGVSDIAGIGPQTPDGEFILIDGIADLNKNNLLNFGIEHAFHLGRGKYAYFNDAWGVLSLVVVTRPLESWHAWSASQVGGGAFDGDADHDGIANGLEYAMSVDPTLPDFDPMPPPRKYLVAWPINRQARDLSITMEASRDLVHWMQLPNYLENRDWIGVSVPTHPDDMPWFYRLKVDLLDP